MAVQWPLRLGRPHEPVLDTCTANVSSGGFYFRSTQAFLAGESLVAVLEIPNPSRDFGLQNLTLHCEVLVVRVETLTGGGSTGIACRIIDYSVLKACGMASEGYWEAVNSK